MHKARYTKQGIVDKLRNTSSFDWIATILLRSTYWKSLISKFQLRFYSFIHVDETFFVYCLMIAVSTIQVRDIWGLYFIGHAREKSWAKESFFSAKIASFHLLTNNIFDCFCITHISWIFFTFLINFLANHGMNKFQNYLFDYFDHCTFSFPSLSLSWLEPAFLDQIHKIDCLAFPISRFCEIYL